MLSVPKNVNLRHAQGIFSFILKWRFTLEDVLGQQKDGRKAPMDEQFLQIFQNLLQMNLGNIQENIVYRLQRSITTAVLHQKTFSGFRNKYAGKEVVLVGAGPSVNQFVPIPNAIYVGLNRAFLLKSVQFDYLFSVDRIGIEKFLDEMAAYRPNECIKFIGDLNCGEQFQIPESWANRLNARRYKTANGIFPYYRCALDIESEPLAAFHSVALQAMQFILYTNPKRIYLVGIDCGNGGKHFAGEEHDVSKRGENIDELMKTTIQEWSCLKQFSDMYYPETEIVSVNPVGLKGMFTDLYQAKEKVNDN